MSRAWLRWMPAVAVPAVIAAGVLAGSIPVWAGNQLPEKTPAEVLALLASHGTTSFSGTLEQTSDLGLPELPDTGPASGPASAGGAASIAELLTGRHTARVFVDGAAKVRIQVVDRLAERDVIRRDGDVWFYTSKDNTAAHLTLPAMARDVPLPQQEAPAVPTPDELARRLLAALDSSTNVTVGPDVEVAGRTAYNLVLEPRTHGTLVGRAAIAVDGQTGLPLKVSVTARGHAEPAFQEGFTTLSLGAPDDSLFTFVPPPGATVKEVRLPPLPPSPVTPSPVTPDKVPGADLSRDAPATADTRGTRPSVTGSGWETVIGIRAAKAGQGSLLSESLLKDPLLAQAAVVVPGGRLLSTALVNVLFTDDGRVFIGMVPPERLQAAAAAAP